MTVNLTSIKQQPYRGQVFNVPYGATYKSRVAPQSCVATINWQAYSASLIPGTNLVDVAIPFQMNAAPASALDIVKSVNIDNSGNLYPVYVYFPDTGYTVLCQANSTRVANVLSTSIAPVICCPGVGNANSDFLTTVYFNNFVSEPENGILPQTGYILDSNGDPVPTIASDKVAVCSTNFDNGNQTIIPGIGSSQLSNIISGFTVRLVELPANGVYNMEFFGSGTTGFTQIMTINVIAATVQGIIYSVAGVRLKALISSGFEIVNIGPTFSATGLLEITVNYGTET